MLKLKNNRVDVSGLSFEIGFALGIADKAYADEGLECIVTAGRDGEHNPGSLHPFGKAVDLSVSGLTNEQHQRIFAKLQRLERYGFDVIDEQAHQTTATTAPHFHIEYDPKPEERFWRLII